MRPCCALSYPTDTPIFAEAVHATHHVNEPVRVQLIAGTSTTGRVLDKAAAALQAIPGTPAAELEKLLAAGKVIDSEAVES